MIMNEMKVDVTVEKAVGEAVGIMTLNEMKAEETGIMLMSELKVEVEVKVEVAVE